MDIKVLGVLGFLLAFILVVVLVTTFSKRASAGEHEVAKPSGGGQASSADLPASSRSQQARKRAG